MVDQEQLDESITYSLDELRSAVFLNQGDKTFAKKILPVESQFTPLHALAIHDFNGDEKPDIIGAGNFYEANIQRGRYDAGYGTVLLNGGEGILHAVPNRSINWFTGGQARDMEWITVDGEKVLVLAKNNEPLQFFKLNPNFRLPEFAREVK